MGYSYHPETTMESETGSFIPVRGGGVSVFLTFEVGR